MNETAQLGLFTLATLAVLAGGPGGLFSNAVPSAEAAIVAQGSVVCDTDRNPMAAKNSNYAMSDKSEIIVYAGGVNGNDSRVMKNSTCVWKFRRAGGAWADITTTSEVKLVDANALIDSAVVAVASRRATQGDPDTYVEAGVECETSGAQTVKDHVKWNEISESQIALSFVDAPDGQQYEFACEWDDFGTPLLLIYQATVTTPTPTPTLFATWGEVKARYLGD